MQHIKYNVHHSLNVVYQLWLNVVFLNVSLIKSYLTKKTNQNMLILPFVDLGYLTCYR